VSVCSLMSYRTVTRPRWTNTHTSPRS
jgi:hypothetical protein